MQHCCYPCYAFVCSQDGNPYEDFRQHADDFLAYQSKTHTEKQYTWEQLSKRFMSTHPGLTYDDFKILAERAIIQLGMENSLSKLMSLISVNDFIEVPMGIFNTL